MKKMFNIVTKSSVILFVMTLLQGQIFAGGLVDLEGFVFDGSSATIDNQWWPLIPGEIMTYVADDGEECFLDIVEVLGPTVVVNGVIAREVLDAEWIDVDCSQGVSAGDVLEEITLDWYTQDTTGNIWYVGEDTISFNWDEDAEEYIDWDEEECDFIDPIDPKICRDGNWEDGEDVLGIGEGDAERGIIMLAEPDHGDFYSQEYYPDVAEDMGKVLNFRKVDTPFLGEFNNCLRTKEWNPLEPGSVEHKFYCYGTGLVLVEENAGGKTLLVDLFFIDP